MKQLEFSAPFPPEMAPQLGIYEEHIFGDGVYAKQICMPAGTYVDKHIHGFTHISFLQAGTVNLVRGGLIKEFNGPVPILIEAGVEHRVVAVTPAIWYCMHITDETDPDDIDNILKL